MLDKLLEKKEKYLKLQAEIKLTDHHEEIEKEVHEFRKSVEERYEKEKSLNLMKVDTYLKCIDELILDLNSDEKEESQELYHQESENNDEIKED